MMGRTAYAQAVQGPLASCALGFEHELRRRGYSANSVQGRLRQFDDLSRWLERRDLAPGELTAERADLFLRERRAAGNASWISPRSMSLPLGYLRAVGAVPPPTETAAEGPVDRLLLDYHRYLVSERGCTERTFARCEPDVRLLLSEWAERHGPDLRHLGAADVSRSLTRECSRRSVAGARRLMSVTRSLLRYLHIVGAVDTSLVSAVPSVADLRDRTLPKGLEPAAVARLLSSCDRRRAVGRRDYAMLLLMARLGLRAGEVASLRLDDLDWHQGQVLVRGKGRRHERLPLPSDVGAALVVHQATFAVLTTARSFASSAL
jgi:site-specific recombinase XerD